MRTRRLTDLTETGLSDALDRGITVAEMTARGDPVAVRAHTVAAFVGRALRGPLNSPVLIKSFAQFQERFGGVWAHSTLGPAVQQYFEHGGARLYIVRVANNARGAMLCLPAGNGLLTLRAVDPGSTERIRAAVDYDGIPDDDEEHFNLTVQRIALKTSLVTAQEIYTGLSCTPCSTTFIADELLGSDLVRAATPTPRGRPAATMGPKLRFDDPYVEIAQRGRDGDELTDYDLIGCADTKSGLFALDAVDDIDLVYLPPRGRNCDVGPAAQLAAERYCRNRGALLIVDPAHDWQSARDAVAGIRASGIGSPNMMTYFPRLSDRSEPGGQPRCVGGALAGLLSRLDHRDGSWQTLENEHYRIQRRYASPIVLSETDQASLRREGINALVPDAAGCCAVRGSVTLARNVEMESWLINLSLRRFCLDLTKSIERATRWAVFEADGPVVAEHVRNQVHAFLAALADRGAFGGRFDVQCDSGLHRGPVDAERGVSILVSFRPTESPTDICLTLHQSARGCRVSSTAFAPAAVA